MEYLSAICIGCSKNISRYRRLVRRNKLGRQGNVAPGHSFADMDTEQGSLSMLFKGITFTALIENKESTYRPKTSEGELGMILFLKDRPL